MINMLRLTKVLAVSIAFIVLLAACGGGDSASASSKLAVDYVNSFLNETDKAKKEKFIEQSVHEDTAPLFALIMSFGELQEPETFENAKAVESINYEQEGQKMDAVLVQADGGKELIVLLLDGKVGLSLNKNADDSMNEEYNKIRSEFKKTK